MSDARVALKLVTDTGLQAPYLTYQEVAKRWRCSKATVKRRIDAGRLDTIGDGQLIRVTLESVLRYETETKNQRRQS